MWEWVSSLLPKAPRVSLLESALRTGLLGTPRSSAPRPRLATSKTTTLPTFRLLNLILSTPHSLSFDGKRHWATTRISNGRLSASMIPTCKPWTAYEDQAIFYRKGRLDPCLPPEREAVHIAQV